MRWPILALIMSTTFAAPLTAQETYAWTYHAQFPIQSSEARLDLVATQPGAERAGPDTDLPRGLVWATCRVADGVSTVSIRFDAFVSNAGVGDTVPFTLSGTSGGSFTADGLYVAPGGQPVGGIEITLPAGGPEMDVLATSGSVRFGVVGAADFHFELDQADNRRYVAQFDADCMALSADDAPQGPDSGAEISQTPVALVPDAGPTISGHDWNRYTFISDDVFQTVLNVSYAVPETDDALLLGFCAIGAQGPYVVLRVVADIGGLSDGDLTTLRVVSADGGTVDLPGDVAGQFSEFGIAGIEVVLETSDPAWDVIAGDPTVMFERLGGQGGLTITGNGPDTIAAFVTDCDQIADLRPEENTTTPVVSPGGQSGALSCERLGQVASTDTGQPMVLMFQNFSGAYRGLMWISTDGAPVDQGGMNAGEVLSFNTDPGHVWMATDGPGNCLEMIQVEPGQVSYNLAGE